MILLFSEVSARLAREVSVETADDREVLLVLVDKERALIVEVKELTSPILVEVSLEMAVLKDAKLYNSELSIIFMRDCKEDKALVSNKEYVLRASSTYRLFAACSGLVGFANPVRVVPEVKLIIWVLSSYASIVAPLFK